MAVPSRELSTRLELREFDGTLDSLCKTVGSGSYGMVYEVKVKGVPRIAKRLHDIFLHHDILPEQKQGIQERFYNECLLLSKLNHPNIVGFIGVHVNPRDQFDMTLVMECLHTDLEKFLRRSSITPSIKYSILLDVTYALLYLHTQLEEPLIHRDLTAANVLITKDVRAKICDLGLSKLLKDYPQSLQAQTICPGTLAYMPPEALIEEPKYDVQLDIFSFGHLALYVAIQQFPQVFAVTSSSQSILTYIKRDELEIFKRRKWIDMIDQPIDFHDKICQCLKDSPEHRPNTEQLNDFMKNLCVQHPKRLQDVIEAWGDQVRMYT